MALTPADISLFYSRGDAKDPRLGELVHSTDVKKAQIVLVGWPDDRGILANKGRVGAASGPQEIRRALFKLTPGMQGETKSVADAGNLVLENTLNDSHKAASASVAEWIKTGKRVVTMGGGNDYAFADARGALEGLGEKKIIGVINIDAH